MSVLPRGARVAVPAAPMRRLLAVALFSITAGAHAADAKISDRAKKLFKSGVELLRRPEGAKYEDAYAAFSAAYQDSPSPQILGNLGFAAMNLERDGEAIEAIDRKSTRLNSSHIQKSRMPSSA